MTSDLQVGDIAITMHEWAGTPFSGTGVGILGKNVLVEVLPSNDSILFMDNVIARPLLLPGKYVISKLFLELYWRPPVEPLS